MVAPFWERETPMTISPIDSYPMPAGDSLPRNTVSWRPDPARAVLLLHDMQAYFLNLYQAGGQPLTDLVAHTRQLRDLAVELGIPVVYTAQPGGMTREQRGLLQDFWGPGMSAGQEDTRIIDELRPATQDVVLTKWRYSAFARSPLHEIIRQAGRDQLLIAGVYAHVGCLITAADAYSLDIQPFLVADAVADFSAADHRLALDYAARCCAAVLSTRETLAMLAGTSRAATAPSHPDTFSIRVSTHIAAPPATVYGYVSDLARSGEWSPECRGGTWMSGSPGAAGSVFRGRNYRRPDVVSWAPVVRGEWTTESEVVEARPPHAFAWAMRDSGGRRQDSVWSFEVSPEPGGSRLLHGFRMGALTEGMREIFAAAGRDREQKFVTDWAAKLRDDMQRSLASIKAVLDDASRPDPAGSHPRDPGHTQPEGANR
jgi:isochorismate hydrolase/uncharacterized protein YndB with AHSA1/START domain